MLFDLLALRGGLTMQSAEKAILLVDPCSPCSVKKGNCLWQIGWVCACCPDSPSLVPVQEMSSRLLLQGQVQVLNHAPCSKKTFKIREGAGAVGFACDLEPGPTPVIFLEALSVYTFKFACQNKTLTNLPRVKVVIVPGQPFCGSDKNFVPGPPDPTPPM